jgi:hypothetical protein
MHDVKKQQSQAIDVEVQKSLLELDERWLTLDSNLPQYFL